jgi:orotidine-5'-phosphate decarboxylase
VPPAARDRGLLSDKPIPPRERLIFALDVPSASEARRLIEQLGDAVHFYKLGLELAMTDGYFGLLRELVAEGRRVFADVKLFDIPETGAAAVRNLARSGASFATVHGNDALLAAACREKGELRVLAVTALTSLDAGDLRDLGFACDVESLVLSRARRALALGCDGVISSGIEAAALRRELGPKFLVVSPGIRPVENRPADDQKRVVTVADAFAAGADYVVVGRPIRSAPDPRAAALAIQATIAEIFA